MALTEWRPMADLFSIRDEMDRLFDDVFTHSPFRRGLLEYRWNPRIDIAETTDEIVVKAELPGMTREDVNISITDNVLTLKGEKKQEEEIKEENYHHVERSYGSFQRSFTLPTSVKPEDAKATFKDGILSINVPKREEAKPKKIKINAE